MTITRYPKNFIPPEHKPEDLVFGSVNSLGKSLSGKALREDGQWTDYLPEDEVQVKKVESSNCTAFATCNAVEVLLEEVGVIENYSDRFLGIAAGTRPPGNTPNKVAQSARDHGFLPESDLPFTGIGSINDYYSPDPLPKNLLDKALEWKKKWSLGYDWVVDGFRRATPEKLMEALKFSPLGVAVFAWAEQNGKYVRPQEGADSHWTLLVGYKEGEYWICLDSYAPHIKKLDWNFGFTYVMRYVVSEAVNELTLYQKLINLLAQLIGIQAIFVKKVIERKKEEAKKVESISNELLNHTREISKPIDNVSPPEEPSSIDIELSKPAHCDVCGKDFESVRYFRAHTCWEKWYIGEEWEQYKTEGKKELVKLARKVCAEEGLPDWLTKELLLTVCGESGWNPFCKGYNRMNGKIVSVDWGVAQLNDNYYLKYEGMTGEEAMNNPERSLRVMAKAFKLGRSNDWIAHRNNEFKKWEEKLKAIDVQ